MNKQNDFPLQDLVSTLRKTEEQLHKLQREIEGIRFSYERPMVIRELIRKIKAEKITYLNPREVQRLYSINTDEAVDILEELRANKLVKTHEDDLYAEIQKWIKTQDKISSSYIQRIFKIGYALAVRMLDQLEDDGIIGPQDGANPRKILK